MLKYKFDIICSFEQLECVRIKLEIEKNVKEEVFFCYIFNKLSNEELHQLQKISIFQKCENESEILSFINECKGKIYLDNPFYLVETRVKEYLNSYIEIMCN